jgi:hypothetical protein
MSLPLHGWRDRPSARRSFQKKLRSGDSYDLL